MARKMTKKQLANLKPQTTRTKKEQREVAKMGGIASGIARRKKRDVFEMLNLIANSQIPEEEAERLRKTFNELQGEEVLTHNSVIAFNTIREAREPKNIMARKQYYDLTIKMMELNKGTQETIEEAKERENTLLEALNNSVEETNEVK